MIRSPFALFLTIVSIQQAVLGSMLTVRLRREADKDEVITISEAGKLKGEPEKNFLRSKMT